MKNIYIIFLGLFCIGNLKGYDLNELKNEYWSYEDGHIGANNFYNYYFYDDGTFLYEFVYSGGAYMVNRIYGNYFYINNNKEISFEIKKTVNTLDKTLKKLTIINFTDDTVSFVINNGPEKMTMHRKTGITRDQYWFKGSHFGGDSIHFRQSGLCEIIMDEIEYLCEYSLVDNVLFLEIKSKIVSDAVISYNP